MKKRKWKYAAASITLCIGTIGAVQGISAAKIDLEHNTQIVQENDKKAHTGWNFDKNHWYYIDDSGAIQTGWLNVGDAWYYLNADGVMATGWIYDDGTWYYLDGNGRLITGWVQEGNTWYYCNTSGAMQTGWVCVKDIWYYLYPNGSMATGWVYDNETWYYSDTNGAMQTGWIFYRNNWYYTNASGAMKTGWLYENAVWYYLDANGAWDAQKEYQGRRLDRLSNDELNSIAGLSNARQDWGYGPSRDEQGRPLDAVNKQMEYDKYGADFVGLYSGNKVYLTIDEGYENGYTAAILDTLKDKNCPAVFFVTLPYVKENPDLVQRIIDEGHILGAHSVSHPANGMPSLSLERQQDEIIELHNYVMDNFGYSMNLFRYPAGIYSEQSLALVQKMGYESAFWSFAYYDYNPKEQPEASAALNKMTRQVHSGAIYLLHAVSATDTQVMGDFIDQIRAAGYEFASYQ